VNNSFVSVQCCVMLGHSQKRDFRPYFGTKSGSWSLSTRFISEILEEISRGTIELENPLKMPDFSDFLTRARPGLKNKAILLTEMMVIVVSMYNRAQKLCIDSVAETLDSIINRK
jgi:hypothetical protein